MMRSFLVTAVSAALFVGCSGGDTQGPMGGGGDSYAGASGGSASASGGTSGGSSGTSGAPSSSGGTSGTSGGTSGTGGGSSGAPANTETWSDGKQITQSTDIVAGATVTIAPGATVTVSSGVTITVHGTLTASTKTSHAKLTGTGWSGIVVAKGGSLSLTGVDISGATGGIHAQQGDTLAQYDYGTMAGGLFNVDVGATMTTDHVAVTSGGASNVNGTFTATYLDYSGSSLSMADASAQVRVADSKIVGVGGDFFTPSAGALLHIEYSTIDSTHCPVHFDGISKFELDHVTTGGTGSTSTSGYGLMIYNADPGPHSITYSNFNDPSWDQTDRTPVIKVDHSFIKSLGPTSPPAGQVTFTNKQAQMVSDARPRATPGPNG